MAALPPAPNPPSLAPIIVVRTITTTNHRRRRRRHTLLLHVVTRIGLLVSPVVEGSTGEIRRVTIPTANRAANKRKARGEATRKRRKRRRVMMTMMTTTTTI